MSVGELDELLPVERLNRVAAGADMIANVAVEQELQSEIARLQNLARLNPAVDQTEIKNLQTHQTSLAETLAETRFRLDSLHLVVVEN